MSCNIFQASTRTLVVTFTALLVFVIIQGRRNSLCVGVGQETCSKENLFSIYYISCWHTDYRDIEHFFVSLFEILLLNFFRVPSKSSKRTNSLHLGILRSCFVEIWASWMWIGIERRCECSLSWLFSPVGPIKFNKKLLLASEHMLFNALAGFMRLCCI